MRQRAAMAAPIPLIAAVVGDSPVIEPGAASAPEEPAPSLARATTGADFEDDEVSGGRRWISSRNLAWAAITLLLITLGAIFLPAPVAMLTGRDRDKIVGVPTEAPPAAVINSSAPVATAAASPNVPAQTTATTMAGNEAQASPPPAATAEPSAPVVASNTVKPQPNEDNADAQTEPEPPAKGPPPSLWDKATGQHRPLQVERVEGNNEGNASNDSNKAADADAKPAQTDDESDALASRNQRRRAASNNLRHPGNATTNRLRNNDDDQQGDGTANRSRNNDDDQNRSASSSQSGHWGRARYIGTTREGYLILRLPSGETVKVPPWQAQLTAPHSRPARRVYNAPYQPFNPYGNRVGSDLITWGKKNYVENPRLGNSGALASKRRQ